MTWGGILFLIGSICSEANTLDRTACIKAGEAVLITIKLNELAEKTDNVIRDKIPYKDERFILLFGIGKYIITKNAQITLRPPNNTPVDSLTFRVTSSGKSINLGWNF